MTPTRLLVQLAWPAAALVAAWFAAPWLAGLPPAAAGLRLYGAWALIAVGLAIALAFNRGRVVFALLTLAGAAAAHALLTNGAPAARGALAALALCAPLNLALFCLLPERGVFSLYGLRRAALLALEAALTLWLAAGDSAAAVAQLYRPLGDFGFFATPLPHSALVVGALALAACLGCWWVRRAPLDLAFAGAVAAVLLALHRSGVPPGVTPFIAAGAALFIVALLQDSFRMAFRDELTGLPGRRALNERLLTLGSRYAVAMVDVDHFKKFNDTHGHDVGDQVLKMVAAELAAVGGGGRAFRYGGEEFTVLFPGRDVEHAGPHLEALRRAIERRRLALRAADRPAQEQSGRRRRGAARGGRAVAVTVSIGLAARSDKAATPEAVIKAADRALYRAKRGGRNRVSR